MLFVSGGESYSVAPTSSTSLLRDSPRGFPSGPLTQIRTRLDNEYRWSTRKPFDDVAKIVCADCNNGWMSQIEVKTRPHLEPLITGDTGNRPVLLPEDAQEAIATWIALRTLIIRSTLTPPTPELLQEWLDWMYSQRTCPENWHVWIANYRGSVPALWESETLHPYRMDNSSPPKPVLDTSQFGGVHMTVVLGYFAYKVFGVRGWKPLNIGGTALVRIAPSGGIAVSWPGDAFLTDDSIIDFVRQGMSSEPTIAKVWNEIHEP